MFNSYSPLERHNFLDKKTLSSYYIDLQNAEISLLEESSANLRLDISDKKYINNIIVGFAGNPEEFRKHNIADFDGKIKMYEKLLIYNNGLIKKYEKSVKKFEKNSKNAEGKEEHYSNKFIVDLLKSEIKKINTRVKSIQDNISSYREDLKRYTEMKAEDLKIAMKNITAVNNKVIKQQENIILENRESIRLHQSVKLMFEDNCVFSE